MDSSLEVSEELLTLLSIQSKNAEILQKPYSGKIQKIYMNLLSFYLDIYLILKIKEREFQLQFAIEYISLNNSSYKYQACKIQSMNPYIFFWEFNVKEISIKGILLWYTYMNLYF